MVIRRCILWLTLMAFTTSSLGCAVTVHWHDRLTKDELIETVEQKTTLPGPIMEAGFDDGEVLKFDEPGATYSIVQDVLSGPTKDGGYLKRDAADLEYIEIETVNTGATVGLTVLVWGAVLAGIFVGLISYGLSNMELSD